MSHVAVAFITSILSFTLFALTTQNDNIEKVNEFRSCMYAVGERSLESYEYCLSKFDRLLVVTPEQLEQSGFKAE